MKKVITLIGAVLCLGMAVPGTLSQQPTNPPKQNFQAPAPVSHDVPAELQSARQKLESAKNDLSRAGDEWGGFRVAAIKNIEEAEANIQKAVEYRNKNLKK